MINVTTARVLQLKRCIQIHRENVEGHHNANLAVIVRLGTPINYLTKSMQKIMEEIVIVQGTKELCV